MSHTEAKENPVLNDYARSNLADPANKKNKKKRHFTNWPQNRKRVFFVSPVGIRFKFLDRPFLLEKPSASPRDNMLNITNTHPPKGKTGPDRHVLIKLVRTSLFLQEEGREDKPVYNLDTNRTHRTSDR
jgi:hypothetical protein